MWKWILKIVHFAATINMRWSTILLVIELLRQFNRSLANSEVQSKLKLAGKAGFVYVIRNRENGERFKIGHRTNPPWRDSQLRSELGESGDFVLIIPAKDASALEKRLRLAYAKHSKKSDWFALNDGERREVLIIAALVQLAAGNDLGMSAVDQEIVLLAKALLKQLQGLTKALYDKGKSAPQEPDQDDEENETEPDLDDFSAIPDMDWNWESVLVEDYRALPKLKGKEAYICIIRDNEAKRGKIFFDNHPVKSIETAFAERTLRIPLEIVMVLKVENQKKAKEVLLPRSEHGDGSDWLELSNEELGEIRLAAAEEYIHGSVYVYAKRHWGLNTLSGDGYKDYPELEKPAGYVCLVQGVKRGKRYKIWTTHYPKRLARNVWLALKLNNPHEIRTSSEPIKFRCLIEAKHAKSFEKFLLKRYRAYKKRNDWFELDDTQLQDICILGT